MCLPDRLTNMKIKNHLTQLNSVLDIRAAAKASNTGSFLHTSAATNGKLILSFLTHNYEQARYIPTSEVVKFMNQTTQNVLKLLKQLHAGKFIKRARITHGRGKAFGWNARP